MRQAKILTKAEYKRVMDVIDAHRYAVRNRTMFALSFYAGLRACEIAGLKVGDVYSEDGTVRNTLYLESEQTKGSEQQQVIVSKQLQKQLAVMLSSTAHTQSRRLFHYFLAVRAEVLVHKQSSTCFLAFTARQD